MPVLQTAKPSNGRQIQCPALRRNKANKLVKVGFICLILLPEVLVLVVTEQILLLLIGIADIGGWEEYILDSLLRNDSVFVNDWKKSH